MKREEIEALRDRKIKATGTHLVALCNALLAAIDAANDPSATDHAAPCPGCGATGGHPYLFGWMTKGRYVIAAIMKEPLP